MRRSRPPEFDDVAAAADSAESAGSADSADGAYEVRRGSRSTLAQAEALSPRLRRRRAFTLLWLTLVAPGSAQLVAGNRRLGAFALRALFTVFVLGLVAALGYLVRRSAIIGLLVNPLFLTVAAGVLLAAALLWAVLFVDSARLGRPRLLPRNTRRRVAVLTAALVVLTSGSLTFAASNVFAGRDAVQGVFGSGTVREPDAGRYNILLMGGDSGTDRVGTRPDTIMLASVDADTGKTVMFGFARDTENIRFRPGSTMARLMPQGWNCGDECLLNGIYQWAMEHKDQFPADVTDPGALATKEAVESLSGLDIQYYGLVDLKGFRRFVDAVGGLDIDVKKRTPIGGGTSPITGWIEPGPQHLDGYHALWYARSREGSSNYERMARQRCVTAAMLQQLSPQTVILKFKDIAGVSGSVLQTDIPDADLGRLGDLALKAKGQRVTSTNFVPPLVKPWDYDPQVIRDKVTQTIDASERAGSEPRASRSAAPRTRAPGESQASPESQEPQSSRDSAGPAASSPSGSGAPAGADDLESVCSAA